MVLVIGLLAGIGWVTKKTQTPVEEPVETIAEVAEVVAEAEISSEMPRGTTHPSFEITVYDENQAYNGTTLFVDTRDNIIYEVNMLGEVIWEFTPPDEWLVYKNIIGLDVEKLENGNVLMVISGSGIYEIDSSGNLIWSHSDPDVSHDVDRLENGNTLYIFGNNDEAGDANVKEVTSAGELVWEWKASDHYEYVDTDQFAAQGWTHVNGAQRLSDGTTLISLRNFYKSVIVDGSGEIVREYDWASFGANVDPHEPQIYEDEEMLLVCLQNDSPYEAVQINLETEEIEWAYNHPAFRTARDCDRLPNGNTLIVGVNNGGTGNAVDMMDDYSVMVEVTPDKEIVWALKIIDETVGSKPGWFYKAERFGL